MFKFFCCIYLSTVFDRLGSTQFLFYCILCFNLLLKEVVRSTYAFASVSFEVKVFGFESAVFHVDLTVFRLDVTYTRRQEQLRSRV